MASQPNPPLAGDAVLNSHSTTVPSVEAITASAPASTPVEAPAPSGGVFPPKHTRRRAAAAAAEPASSPQTGSQLQALERLERLRWNGSVCCPTCGERRVTPKTYKPDAKRPGATPQRWHCAICRRDFSVLVGTLFEHTFLPLECWLKAFELFAASMTPLTATDLQIGLAIASPKTCYRILKLLRSLDRQPGNSADDLLRMALAMPTDRRAELYPTPEPQGDEEPTAEDHADAEKIQRRFAHRLTFAGDTIMSRAEHVLNAPPDPNPKEHMAQVIRAGRAAQSAARIVNFDAFKSADRARRDHARKLLQRECDEIDAMPAEAMVPLLKLKALRLATKGAISADLGEAGGGNARQARQSIAIAHELTQIAQACSEAVERSRKPNRAAEPAPAPQAVAATAAPQTPPDSTTPIPTVNEARASEPQRQAPIEVAAPQPQPTVTPAPVAIPEPEEEDTAGGPVVRDLLKEEEERQARVKADAAADPRSEARKIADRSIFKRTEAARLAHRNLEIIRGRAAQRGRTSMQKLNDIDLFKQCELELLRANDHLDGWEVDAAARAFLAFPHLVNLRDTRGFHWIPDRHTACRHPRDCGCKILVNARTVDLLDYCEPTPPPPSEPRT